MVTVSLLDGKIKIGKLGRIGPVELKVGEVEVYKLVAYGAVAAVAYCNLIHCQVPTDAELNVKEVEAGDDEPTPAKAEPPSISTRK